jgi:hypothetical protein
MSQIWHAQPVTAGEDQTASIKIMHCQIAGLQAEKNHFIDIRYAQITVAVSPAPDFGDTELG